MTQITLPPNTRTVGQGNPPADMDQVITALMAAQATSWVTPSGDTSGTADPANANAAIAANGLLVMGPGAYYFNAAVGPLTTNQWILCQPGVIIHWLGTGDCFRWVDTSTYTTRTVQGGGILGRPIIDGASDGAGSCALHAGDILGFRFDIAVQNFVKAGDIAIHLDNQNFWTEQAIGVAYISNCTQDVVFDCGGAATSTGSFDRSDFTFYVQHKTFTGDVFTWQNGAQQVGGWFRAYGNIASGTSPFTQSVLSITGQTPGGHSPATYSGLQCGIDISVESDGGHAYTFRTISFGSVNNVITGSSGSVDFGLGNQFTQSNITSVSSQFRFIGPIIGDATLNEINVPSRFSVSSEVFFFSTVEFNGIAGAQAGYRLVGAIASGTAPVTGTFKTGDVIIVLTGSIIICTAGGTQGTWAVA